MRVPSLAHREPRWSAVVLAVAAVFILVATISVTIGVAGQFALAGAGRLVDGEPTGIDDNLVTEASVLAALLAVGTLHRVARWQWRVRASELGSYDPRDALLYLRGFSDDRLKVPAIVSARLPLFELAAPVARDSFEAVAGWELEAVGPVVAIAAPQGGRRDAGAVQEDILPDFWQSQVRVRMGKRPVVALSLGCSAGVL